MRKSCRGVTLSSNQYNPSSALDTPLQYKMDGATYYRFEESVTPRQLFRIQDNDYIPAMNYSYAPDPLLAIFSQYSNNCHWDWFEPAPIPTSPSSKMALKQCPHSTCGNGVVECNEECDMGKSNGQPGSLCDYRCKWKNVWANPQLNEIARALSSNGTLSPMEQLSQLVYQECILNGQDKQPIPDPEWIEMNNMQNSTHFFVSPCADGLSPEQISDFSAEDLGDELYYSNSIKLGASLLLVFLMVHFHILM